MNTTITKKQPMEIPKKPEIVVPPRVFKIFKHSRVNILDVIYWAFVALGVALILLSTAVYVWKV